MNKLLSLVFALNVSFLLCACNSSSSNPKKETDTQPPTATALAPTVDATGVEINTKVIVAFNEAIDPESVGPAAFQLMAGTSLVAAAVNHDQTNNLLVLIPDTNLAFSTTYKAVVSATITDLAGNQLGADYSWSFTTRSDNTIPQLLQINPTEDAIDVPVDVVVSAHFDEPIDANTVAGFVITGVDGQTSVAGDGSIVRFVPDQPLLNITTYEITLPSTLKDLAGNQLNYAKTWSFTTVPDLIAPEVIQTTPGEGAVIPIDQRQVTIEFNEPLDAATIIAANISVTQNGVSITPSSFYLSPATRIIINLPPLVYEADYAIHIASAVTDLVGNGLVQEFVLNFSAEPDTVAPSVLRRAPGVDGRVVPPASVMRVQFNEPMDRNTISPNTVKIQGVTGIVSYDEATDIVTFIPNSSLTPGQQYTAQVAASVTDLAGNPLPAAESWTFTVDGAPLQVSDNSSSAHGAARVAFGGTEGFAVWSVNSGTGVKLVAAQRNTKSTTFATEQTIVEYPGDNAHLQVAIASNGTTFALVWVRPYPGHVYASIHADGAWSAPIDLGPADGGPGRLGILSNGDSYVVGWNDLFSYYAAIYDGTDWSSEKLGQTSSGFSGPVGPLELVSDGTGYAMTWVGRVSIYNGSSWSTLYKLDAVDVQIAVGTTGYGICWRQLASTYPNRDWIYARVYNGTSWLAETQLTSYGSIGGAHDIASNGSGYAVIATARVDASDGNKSVDVYQYNGTNWTLTNLQTVAWNGPTATQVQIASNGSTYAATWRQNDALLASVNLATAETLFAASVSESMLVSGGGNYYVVQNNAGGRISVRAYVTTNWMSEFILSASDSAAQSLDVVVNGPGVLIGYGTNTNDARMALYTAFLSGSIIISTSANRLLVTGTHPGGVRNPVAAVNGNGDTLLVWQQYNAGVWQIRGRRYRNGVLGPVHLISAGGQWPAIAADAASFMVVWGETGEVHARRYTSATDILGADVLLGAASTGTKPSIAYNGTTFLAGWTEARNVRVAEFNGTWAASEILYTDPSSFQKEAKVASVGGEYAIVWLDDDLSSDAIHARVRIAAAWGGRVQLDYGTSLGSPALLSNGSSYAVLYTKNLYTYARVHEGAWAAAASLGYGGYLAATNGDEYRVLYGTAVYDERVYAAGAWGTAIDANLKAVTLACDGNSYALLGVEKSGASSTLYSASRSADGWSLTVPIVTVTSGTIQSVVLSGGAGVYHPLWSQSDAVHAITHRLWLLPDN